MIKQKAVLAVLVVLIIALIAPRIARAASELASWSCCSEEVGCYTSVCRDAVGIYPTLAAAQAARETWVNQNGGYVSSGGIWTAWGTSNYSCDSNYSSIGVYNSECPVYISHAFCWPKDGVMPDQTTPPGDNNDGDCLPDDIDPFPNNADNFFYRVIAEYQDSTGAVQTKLLETDTGYTFRIGDIAFANSLDSMLVDGIVVMQMGSNFQEGCGLAAEFGETDATVQSGGGSTYNVISGGEIEVPTASNITSGQTSTGSETEIEALQKTVDNTAVIAGNQQTMANYLKGIYELHSTIYSTGIPGSGQSVVVQQLKEMVANQEQEKIEAEEAELGVTLDDQDYQGEVGEEEIPEEESLEDELDILLLNNPVTEALNGSGCSIVDPACSFTWNYKGKDIVFTICKYETELGYIGVILVGLAALNALMMIIKGN